MLQTLVRSGIQYSKTNPSRISLKRNILFLMVILCKKMKLLQSMTTSTKKIKFTKKAQGLEFCNIHIMGNPDFEPFWNTWNQSEFKYMWSLVQMAYDVPDIEAMYLKLKYPDWVFIDEN